MWYTYTMEYYAAIKRNEILSFAMKWMELEGITLSEISQSEKDNKIAWSPWYEEFEKQSGGIGGRERKNETRYDWEEDKP